MGNAETESAPAAESSDELAGGTWGPRALVLVLLGFWSVWWSLVFSTNFFEALKVLDILGSGWSFASGNYGFLVSVMEVHGTPEIVVALLFAGGIAWELAVAVLTWLAFAGYARGAGTRATAYRAFVPAVAFFGAFLALTEFFIAYDLANTHVRLFIAALLSLFVIVSVGDDTPAGR
jgi:hypothetical protein